MLVAAAAGLFTACSNTDDLNHTDFAQNNAPSTEVYMGVNALNNLEKINTTTRATENLLSPVVNVAYFNVKVDPRLGYVTPANSYLSAVRNGKAYTDCPYITINKGNDYTYLLSTDGSAMHTLIAAGDTATARIQKMVAKYYQRTNPISPTVNENNIHVIWYLAKDMNNGFHIDGLLTDKADIKEACDACKDEGYREITFGENGAQLTYGQLMDYFPVNHNIKPFSKALGVDIHQQEHQNWGEIKTSIHLKEAKDVKIFIPVSSAYTVENVDTNEVVRYFEKYFEVQDYDRAIGAQVDVKVTRQDNGVTIYVTGVTTELLKALERRYNDGFTVEVHTFYTLTEATKPTVWQAIKKAQINYDGNISGQITSAYYADDSITF